MNKTGIAAGDQFGRLTVLADKGMCKRQRIYECGCTCGSVVDVGSRLLKTGRTKSCGCLRRETTREVHTKHGRTGSGEHNSWLQMMKRCTDPSSHLWKHYGGRGIKVCERWKEAKNFMEDMGPRPAGHSIERIDVDRDYELANCKWATQAEQALNTRRTVRLTVDGHTKTALEWSQISGVPVENIRERHKRGWNDKRSVTEALNEARFSTSNQPGKS
jgi:hypothetical protein